MRSRRATCFTLAFALSIVALSSRAAEAQTAPPAQTERALPVMRGGQRVWVTTADGREVAGKLVSFTPARVVVRSEGGETPILFGDVRKIEVPDALGNGIRNGAIVGGGLFAMMSISFVHDFCGRTCSGSVPFVLVETGIGAGLGAGIGALVDHLIVRRDVIYSAAPGTASVRVVPIVSAKRTGLGLSISWH